MNFRPTIALTLILATLGAASCSGPTKKARKAEPVVRDIPAILRGTIGTESSIRGIQPILVSGYGIVVGLNGTGGGLLPDPIQKTMERELAKNGIGRGGILNEGPLAGKTPKQVLRDPNVAVVIVEGVIPPGAPKGARFDVRVRALPESGVTSLEGGRLWTTELRLGPATRFGAMKTRKIGTVEGTIFINPFADPAAAGNNQRVSLGLFSQAPGQPTGQPPVEPLPDSFPVNPDAGAPGNPPPPGAPAPPAAPGDDEPVVPPAPVPNDGISRTVGRVLGGGSVTEPLRLDLVLDNPSHSRASAIKDAINSRFPAGPADDGDIARGRSDSSVAVRVPAMYRDRAAEFIQLLTHLQIDQAFTPEYAKRYSEELTKEPILADDLSWALQAIGKASIPFLVPLYTSPEFLPRMAALRAGAKLGDLRAAPHLREIASDPNRSVNFRAETIELLGQLLGTFDPQTTVALRKLLSAQELQIRVAAYEALVSRRDSSVTRISIDDKFLLDVVPSSDELIYVSQQGQPRIVFFGENQRLNSPIIVSAWSGRMLIKGGDIDSGATGAPLIQYQDYRSTAVTRGPVPGGGDLVAFVKFIGHTPTPENPTAGLSLTYSEVVGALYEVQKQRGVVAAFATEQDRLIARIAAATESNLVEDRPDSEADDTGTVMKPSDKVATGQAGSAKPANPVRAANPEPGPGSLVVPLSPKQSKPK